MKRNKNKSKSKDNYLEVKRINKDTNKNKRNDLNIKKKILKKNQKKIKGERNEKHNNDSDNNTVEKLNQKKLMNLFKIKKKKNFSNKNHVMKEMPTNKGDKGKLQFQKQEKEKEEETEKEKGNEKEKEKKKEKLKEKEIEKKKKKQMHIRKLDFPKEKYVNPKRKNKNQLTEKHNEQIKNKKKVTSLNTQLKNEIPEDAELSKTKIKKKDNMSCIKKQDKEWNFSCLDNLCKYKMRIKRQRMMYENEETTKNKKQTELKKKDKHREKEKLKENPEDVVNSSLFRYINEYMYKNRSEIVQKKFNESKTMFHIYHTGYKNQINKWPNNPTQIIIDFLKHNFTEKQKIADFGCGEALIAQSLQNWNIISFDLIQYNKYVTVGNITKLDEPKNSYDCIVVCLSLMNTDWPKIIEEASRCLKKNGILVIAEVASRFIKYKFFFRFMRSMKFKTLKKANLDDFFFLFFFENMKNVEQEQCPMSQRKVQITSELLAPCLYRRR